LDDITNDLQETIVMELMIQVSDVAHTMQHWHVYRKWNRLLFQEMCFAYRLGRLIVDPGAFWYQEELSFLDHYVLPLVQNIKDCQVFGSSSDKYYHYATRNRSEWKIQGMDIVSAMIDKFSSVMSSEVEEESIHSLLSV
jgi:hypothetical protein